MFSNIMTDTLICCIISILVSQLVEIKHILHFTTFYIVGMFNLHQCIKICKLILCIVCKIIICFLDIIYFSDKVKSTTLVLIAKRGRAFVGNCEKICNSLKLFAHWLHIKQNQTKCFPTHPMTKTVSPQIQLGTNMSRTLM